MKDKELRDKYLTLLIDEGIGNPNKRNLMGLLPQEIEHIQPVKNIPGNLMDKNFRETLQEIQEADYVIVSSQWRETLKGKKDIVVEQLKDLDLKEAAPNLLSALENLVERNLIKDKQNDHYQEVLEAIAKARGEKQ